jgi:uncharacterized protein YbbC (DUF1343 family)
LVPARVFRSIIVNFHLRASIFLVVILSFLIGFTACFSGKHRPARPVRVTQTVPPGAPAITPSPGLPPVQGERIFPIMLGVDVLERSGFSAIKGKRIGLLTHAAGVNRRGESTVDVLRRAPGVRLVALFAPEHGLYGTGEAGKNLLDSVDSRTGLPVYSLYGKSKDRKPTKMMLAGLDALVIDLQDIGVRSYTFSSAMLYAMESCFQNNVEVIVLDRPNPLGGLKVDGPPMDKTLMSYVGAFRVPYVHGLTIGELARLAAATPGALAEPEAVRLKGRLTVVPMQGWRRSMRWPDTGLKFVPTSPFVQDFFACVGYAMTGLGCEIGGFTHGNASTRPFVAFRGKTSEQLQKELEALKLPGLVFVRTSPPVAGRKPSTEVQIEVANWAAWQPTDLSFYMMRLACRWNAQNPFATAPADKISMFNKLTGSETWYASLSHDGARVNVEGFLADWRQQARVFQQQSRRFWLYPE